jgi:hypothetical protein
MMIGGKANYSRDRRESDSSSTAPNNLRLNRLVKAIRNEVNILRQTPSSDDVDRDRSGCSVIVHTRRQSTTDLAIAWEDDRERASAVMIQRTYRGYNKKLIFDAFIADVITVQSVARRWIINMRLRKVRQIHDAATKIQTTFRGSIVRMNYIFTVLEIVLCQSIVRRNIVRMRYRREIAIVATQKTKRIIEHAAATKIQSTYRVFTARRNINISIRDRAKLIAAITIQKTYRGVKERRKIDQQFLRRGMSTVATAQKKTCREFNKRQINRLHSMTDEDQLVTFKNEHVDGTCNVYAESCSTVPPIIVDSGNKSSGAIRNTIHDQLDRFESALNTELRDLELMGVGRQSPLGFNNFESDIDPPMTGTSQHRLLMELQGAVTTAATPSLNALFVAKNIRIPPTTTTLHTAKDVKREIKALVSVVIPDESDNVDEMLCHFKGREISLRNTLRGIYARDILGSITSDVSHVAEEDDTVTSKSITISSCDGFDLNVYLGDDNITTLSIHSALHHSSSQGQNIEGGVFFARTSSSSPPSTNTTSLILYPSRWKKMLVICIVAASPLFVVCVVIVGLYINSRASGDSVVDDVGFANTAPPPAPVIVETTSPTTTFPSIITDSIVMPTNNSVGNVTMTLSNNSLTPTIPPSVSPIQTIETSSSCYSIIISILYDANPFGSGFVIRRTNTAVTEFSYFPSDDSLAYQYYNESICLEQGRYSFTMYDKNGNGLCCGLNNGRNGQYTVLSNDIVLVEGGEFAYEEETLFDLPALTNHLR